MNNPEYAGTLEQAISRDRPKGKPPETTKGRLKKDGGIVRLSKELEQDSYNDYNSNITNSNISASANIAATKLNLSSIAQTIAMSSVAINFAKGADIASATTTDIGAASGNVVDITGTTTITGFGTVQAGTLRVIRFTGALTLTHNATSLILPTGASITTASGDIALAISLGSGNWYVAFYTQAGTTAVAATQAQMEAASSTSVMVTPGRTQYHPGVAKAWVKFDGSGTVTINASHNVSSITDNGTGDYTINYTTAFSSANYSVVMGTRRQSSETTARWVCVSDTDGQATTSCRINVIASGSGLEDRDEIYFAAYGDQ